MDNRNQPNFIFGIIAVLFLALTVGKFIPFFVWFIIIAGIFNSSNRSKRKNRDREYSRRRVEEQKERNQRRRAYEERRQGSQDMRRRRADAVRQQSSKDRVKVELHKKQGLQKFKEYDYDGAIEEFEIAIRLDPKEVSIHFNLACAYSLNEDKKESLYHLEEAIKYGFKDFEKIKSHDALAWLRIQPEFETIKENGFTFKTKKTEEDKLKDNHNLLEQLNRLQDLRERQILTEEEFVIQKKKLLG